MGSKNLKFGQTHILIDAISFAVMILYALYTRKSEILVGIILVGVCLVVDVITITIIQKKWDTVLKVIRLVELLAFSVLVVYCPTEVKQISTILYFILCVHMLELVFLFEFTDSYSRTISIGLMLLPITLMILLDLIFSQENDPGNINSVGTIAILAILIVILSKTSDIFTEWLTLVEHRVYEQRRMADSAKEMNETLKIHQQKIRKANEELTVQKLKMELANDTINRVNSEIKIQNAILQCLNSSLDLESLSENVPRVIMETSEHISFCCMLLAPLDKKDELIYNAEIGNVSEAFMKSFSATVIEQGLEVVNNRNLLIDKKLTDKIYDDIQPEDKLLVTVALPLCINNEVVGLILGGSDIQDNFDDAVEMFNNLAAQVVLAIKNIRLYHEIQQSAITDGLTGLLNRRRLNEIMVRYSNDAIVNHIPLSVALIDIDHFKKFNDTYGHACGDMVLAKLARVLERNAEENGGIAARYGGEEFVIAALGLNLQEMREVLDKIKSEVDEAVYEYEGNKINIRVSMGYTCYPEIATTPNEVLNRADSAMYYSKEHGRNQITCDGETVTAFIEERENNSRSKS